MHKWRQERLSPLDALRNRCLTRPPPLTSTRTPTTSSKVKCCIAPMTHPGILLMCGCPYKICLGWKGWDVDWSGESVWIAPLTLPLIMYRGSAICYIYVRFTTQFWSVSDRRKVQPPQLIFHNSNTQWGNRRGYFLPQLIGRSGECSKIPPMRYGAKLRPKLNFVHF